MSHKYSFAQRKSIESHRRHCIRQARCCKHVDQLKIVAFLLQVYAMRDDILVYLLIFCCDSLHVRGLFPCQEFLGKYNKSVDLELRSFPKTSGQSLRIARGASRRWFWLDSDGLMFCILPRFTWIKAD
jgi:hypothetical protein